ncbi:MAG: hypothetical protein CL677_06400 [Bdellovibrionaceae bacterium]|nr:hypothetical protein [Pseudobdellovibrionaceae bacterium]|tara:strand:+ start:31925 stop:32215 length:291 start_codon:yes stop_codon:yes gene_type:complete
MRSLIVTTLICFGISYFVEAEATESSEIFYQAESVYLPSVKTCESWTPVRNGSGYNCSYYRYRNLADDGTVRILLNAIDRLESRVNQLEAQLNNGQ